MPNRNLMASLELSERCVLTPYQDNLGNWTVGIGHLMSNPITRNAALHILVDDIKIAEDGFDRLPQNATTGLSPNRRDVIIEMIFQLGITRFMKFHKMISALGYKDHEKVYDEMLDSLWAKQTPGRAQRLAEKYRKG